MKISCLVSDVEWSLLAQNHQDSFPTFLTFMRRLLSLLRRCDGEISTNTCETRRDSTQLEGRGEKSMRAKSFLLCSLPLDGWMAEWQMDLQDLNYTVWSCRGVRATDTTRAERFLTEGGLVSSRVETHCKLRSATPRAANGHRDSDARRSLANC